MVRNPTYFSFKKAFYYKINNSQLNLNASQRKLDHLASSAGIFEHDNSQTLRDPRTFMEEEFNDTYQTDRNFNGKEY